MQRKISLLARSQRCAQITEQYSGLDQYLRKQRYKRRGPRINPYKEAILLAHLDAPGLRQRELAAQFGVSQGTVSRIVKSAKANNG